jgi:hypothetical protein
VSTHAVVLLEVSVDWYGSPRHFDVEDLANLAAQGLEGHYTNIHVVQVNDPSLKEVTDDDD